MVSNNDQSVIPKRHYVSHKSWEFLKTQILGLCLIYAESEFTKERPTWLKCVISPSNYNDSRPAFVNVALGDCLLD